MNARVVLLLALGLLAAAEPHAVAGTAIELRIPPELTADPTPPPGTRAAWRSADGLVGLALVRHSEATPTAASLDAQLAVLRAHAQAFELVSADEVDGWQRLRYRLDLGERRYEQESRLRMVGDEVLVLTASWPLAASDQWRDLLTRSLTPR